MDLGIARKVALVTGGSRGIGRAIALELAREGAHVCIVARDEQRLATTLAELEQLNVPATSVSADLSTGHGCRTALDHCTRLLGPPDILINNAGAASNAPILDLLTDTIDDALNLKLYGYLRLAQLTIPHMRQQGWGRVVNIAGGAGASPTADNFATGLPNAGILNLTRALSDTAAADGVNVNVICPGVTDTDRARAAQLARSQRTGRPVDELLTEAASRLPAGRIATPQEIAQVAAFLASDAASYVHGSSIYMDGGARRASP